MPTYYHNEMLFSEIYLEEITQIPEEAEVSASLDVLSQYRQYADTSTLLGWQTSYIHEVLSALGFYAQSKTDHLVNLFPLGTSGEGQQVSICYVVSSEDNLNNTTIGRNWAEKIIRALRENNLQWGLLTNGKQWRIYHQDEPTPYETYLEIDLEAILKEKAKEAYQIFHKFMKAENFTVQEDGECQFDRFKKESQNKIDYIEKELANALKQREEGGKGVLSDLCMGYVEELRHRNEGNFDDETLRMKIYHGAMLYMFRLLFLFYADARGLLSDENHELLTKVESVCRARHDGEGSSDLSFHVWDNLEHIFVDIDQTYNGGLFSPQESEFTRFLSDTRVGDAYIANVIFNLTTYREKNSQEKSISYRDMSVRHLGTLYEGLLEHKLYIANEDTEVKVSKGKIQFLPVSQGGKLLVGHYIKAGEIYFAGDPSERRSTGSYYTPEYIVDYIVRNTVGEKLNGLKDDFLQEQRPSLEAHHRAVDEDERQALSKLLEENALSFVKKKVLDLSVLDPAMGSGHFLVNATNLIANSITEILGELGIEGTISSGTAFWRRWVVENCIYGVDLNPLAVELAKLSLWILSMTKDLPLSFLNHHLKCGNSLIGTRLEDIGHYPFSASKKEDRQLALFEHDPDFKAAVEEAVFKIRQIGTKSSTTLEDVKEKKAWLEEIEQVLEGYKTICNVHTGLFFSNEMDEREYVLMVEKKDFKTAKLFEKPNQFFNWELEFPEACISKDGFSCIICNPPFDTFKENSFFSRGEARGTGNLFSHFIVKQVSLNLDKGNIGFVVPLSFACGSSYENVRKLVYQNYEGIFASHYSIRPAKLFPGIDQRITLFFTKEKTHSRNCLIYSSRLWRWNLGQEEFVVNNPDLGFLGRQNEGFIPKVAGKIGADIYKKIVNSPTTLSTLMCESEYIAYFHGIARYWIKTYDFIPFFKREGEITPSKSSTIGNFCFSSEFSKYLFLLLTNSSLFYYWWITRSDEFHVLSSDFTDFGINDLNYFQRHSNEVVNLAKELMKDYQIHSIRSSGNAGGRKISFDIFFPRKSIAIIHKIDDLVAEAYKFDNKINDFIKNYDIEFRTDE